MRISVIGCGYLGAVHAASMAELGHEVVGIDVDPGKIQALAAGEAPFFEPGLSDILQSASSSGRLTFTTDIAAARGARVHFIAVGTPQARGGGAADLSYVNAATEAFCRTSPTGTSSSASPPSPSEPRNASPSASPPRGPARPSRGTPSSCARATR
jgi:nucleotide sugar dehydrogenase